MATKKNTVKVKQDKKQAEKKEITPNNIFEVFMGNNSILSPPLFKLRMNLSGKLAYDLEKHVTRVLESVESKAYQNRKKEIISAFQKEQEAIEDPKDRKEPTVENIPGLLELLNMDSGFVYEKMAIDVNKFLPDLTAILMKKLDAENAKEKPNQNLIKRLEDQILQERERQLTAQDMAILRNYFDFEG
jgi:hypothetical protein